MPAYDKVIFPTLVSRIKAVFVDLLILLFTFAIVSLVIDAIGGTSDFVKGFILIFMVYLYDPVLTAFTGGTIGHKLIGLKIRKYKEPEKYISFGSALLRFLIKGSLGWISFLTVTSNEHKRAIHDQLSGSITLKIK
jgi:hypothetical protein